MTNDECRMTNKRRRITSRRIRGDFSIRHSTFDIRHLPLIFAVLLVAAVGVLAEPPQTGGNILPNPSFESTEPPVPTPETAKKGAPREQWMPRTWEVSVSPGAQYRCPDDAKQAHSGRRCVYFQTAGPGAVLRYGPLPVFDKQPWTASVWLRGKGTAVLSAFEYEAISRSSGSKCL